MCSTTRLTDAIDFTFPSQTLSPGQFVLVAQDQTAFEAFYGNGLNVAGKYGTTVSQSNLANGGEILRLADPLGRTIRQFTYDDQGLWPGRADGHGSSLEIMDVTGNYNLASNWRASSEFFGSPGLAGTVSAATVVINEVLAHSALASVDFLELVNTSAGTVDLSD